MNKISIDFNGELTMYIDLSHGKRFKEWTMASWLMFCSSVLFGILMARVGWEHLPMEDDAPHGTPSHSNYWRPFQSAFSCLRKTPSKLMGLQTGRLGTSTPPQAHDDPTKHISLSLSPCHMHINKINPATISCAWNLMAGHIAKLEMLHAACGLCLAHHCCMGTCCLRGPGKIWMGHLPYHSSVSENTNSQYDILWTSLSLQLNLHFR